MWLTTENTIQYLFQNASEKERLASNNNRNQSSHRMTCAPTMIKFRFEPEEIVLEVLKTFGSEY